MSKYTIFINYMLVDWKERKRNMEKGMEGRKEGRKNHMSCKIKILDYQTDKMAQQIEALATKPEGLSSIPGTHIVGRKNQGLQVVL